MATLSLENFELGISAVPDLVSRADDEALDLIGAPDWARALAKGNNTNFAPAEYGRQVAEDPTNIEITQSHALTDAAKAGVDPKALGAAAQGAAQKAVDEGALGTALRSTAKGVFDRGVAAVESGGKVLAVAGVLAAAVGAGVVAWRLTPRRAAA